MIGGTLEVGFLFCFCFLWVFFGGGGQITSMSTEIFHTFVIYNVVRFLLTDKTTNGIINKQRGTTCLIKIIQWGNSEEWKCQNIGGEKTGKLNKFWFSTNRLECNLIITMKWMHVFIYNRGSKFSFAMKWWID